MPSSHPTESAPVEIAGRVVPPGRGFEWKRGQRACLSMARAVTKLSIEIVGPTFPRESDPRYQPKDLLVHIREMCDHVEEELGIAGRRPR